MKYRIVVRSQLLNTHKFLIVFMRNHYRTQPILGQQWNLSSKGNTLMDYKTGRRPLVINCNIVMSLAYRKKICIPFKFQVYSP